MLLTDTVPDGDGLVYMRAIVRLCSYLDSTDVQLYNRVSCEDYITRFKEVCSKSNNIREQFAFVKQIG